MMLYIYIIYCSLLFALVLAKDDIDAEEARKVFEVLAHAAQGGAAGDVYPAQPLTAPAAAFKAYPQIADCSLNDMFVSTTCENAMESGIASIVHGQVQRIDVTAGASRVLVMNIDGPRQCSEFTDMDAVWGPRPGPCKRKTPDEPIVSWHRQHAPVDCSGPNGCVVWVAYDLHHYKKRFYGAVLRAQLTVVPTAPLPPIHATLLSYFPDIYKPAAGQQLQFPPLLHTVREGPGLYQSPAGHTVAKAVDRTGASFQFNHGMNHLFEFGPLCVIQTFEEPTVLNFLEMWPGNGLPASDPTFFLVVGSDQEYWEQTEAVAVNSFQEVIGEGFWDFGGAERPIQDPARNLFAPDTLKDGIRFNQEGKAYRSYLIALYDTIDHHASAYLAFSEFRLSKVAPMAPVVGVQVPAAAMMKRAEVGKLHLAAETTDFSAEQPPAHVADRTFATYLNKNGRNSGVVFNRGLVLDRVDGLNVWPALDSLAFNPISVAVYGTNRALLHEEAPFPLDWFQLLHEGPLSAQTHLPQVADRTTPLRANDHTRQYEQRVLFPGPVASARSFRYILVLFPDVQGPPHSPLQVSEVEPFKARNAPHHKRQASGTTNDGEHWYDKVFQYLKEQNEEQ